MKNALVWLQRVADIQFGADKVELTRMVKTTKSAGGSSDPEAAPMIPIGVVKLLEEGCFKAS